MIGGFIVGAGLGNNGAGSARVVVRAIGPSLTQFGVPNALDDPTLELHDNAAVISANDDWKQTQQSDIEATGLPPTDDRESAILRWVPPTPYTAVLRGKDSSTGIGLLEIYDVTK